MAALSRPSTLAETFIIIAPLAAWPGGTAGNRWRISGFTSRANRSTTPARSPTRMMPSHSAIMPVRPSAISKPVRAASNMPVSMREKTSMSPIATCTQAVTKATRKKASQTRLRATVYEVGAAILTLCLPAEPVPRHRVNSGFVQVLPDTGRTAGSSSGTILWKSA